jgi:hypothetical protein
VCRLPRQAGSELHHQQRCNHPAGRSVAHRRQPTPALVIRDSRSARWPGAAHSRLCIGTNSMSTFPGN